MKNKLKSHFLAYTLIAALLLSGCSSGGGTDTSGLAASAQSGSAVSSKETADTIADVASDKVKSEDLDADWDEATATKIILNGDNADVDGAGATVSGSIVTIGSEGDYVVSGSLADGQIIVNAPEKALVRLVLNGINISNSTTSPIYCEQADKLLIILAEGSINTITDSGSYIFPDADTDEPDAAVFSKADLTFNGTGTLTVNANYYNGIGTKDDLVIVSGTFRVTAPNNAIRGRDSVTVLDGDFTLNSKNDGIQANNDKAEDKGWIELYGGSYDITAAHDGVQAETWLTVAGGDYKIVTGGGSVNAPERAAEVRGGGGPGGMMNPPPGAGNRGQMPPADGTAINDAAPLENMLSNMSVEADDSGADTASDSFKGIKAGTDLTVTGGVFVLDSADDALHANRNISISGGEFTISTGDDGMHADEDLVISGSPKIDILTSYEAIEGSTVTISGGDINIVAKDDGINAAGGADSGESGMFGKDRFNSSSGEHLIRIEGGNITIAAGADGLDSNGDLNISGGVITFNMTNLNAIGGDGMIDRDGTLTITGGTISGAGGNGIVTMGQGAGSSTSTQPILELFYTNAQTAGTLVELKDAAGNIIAVLTPEYNFKCVIFSASELREGQSYSVYTADVKTLDITLSGSVTSLQDTGEAAVRTMGGRGDSRNGGRPAAPVNP